MSKRGPVLLGAGGTVGHRIVRAWDDMGVEALCLTRRDWDMAGPPPELPAARDRAVVVLPGAIPGDGRDMAANIELARAGVAAGRFWGAPRIFVLSSSAVYGATGATPADEDSPPDPAGAYGRAKLEMEQAVAAGDVTALRLANVAGASEPFRTIASRQPAQLDRFPDGAGPSRSYAGPVTLARALAALATHARDSLPPVLNLANPHPVAMAEIFAAAGHPVTWRTAPERAVQRVHLDCTRMAAICALPDLDATGLWAEVRAT